ncbi:helix-turn-helix transcriptional regulator [Bacillus alkalicellulosilyticus]|uniref:helix-turn-helix transcriptional regulator n=1 Tax=Alkalihalobacterium alkalicellulosilyticum TaxID=1912214 RepID=UPI001FE765B1|nr:WYL domain-containing protein [Bacillus alkalicellulosilyticus]
MNTKLRLLYMREILQKYTDEENQLTLEQMLDLFYRETKTHIGKKASRDDIDMLESSGLFDVTINQEKNGVEKYYSHQQRLFELYELRLLIDAVSAAKFITKNETEKLVGKIKRLTSLHLAKQLENRVIMPDSHKNENQRVKLTIHELHNAIMERNVIEFQYGKYNLQKEFKFNHDGKHYRVKPYALVWNQDFYYMIAEYQPKELRHYRVDRMRNVSTVDEKFIPDRDFNVTKYTEKLFHMYSGEEQEIQVRFSNHLINVMIDRFGRDVSIRQDSGTTFVLSTKAIISEGLIRWLLTWGSDAIVLYPVSLVDTLKKEINKMSQLYS